ncbi:rhombosortase [Vibrio mimicus]|uniref:rhombosortase n=1 Tax=Vibrio mimicus TaxID=674 RepID=UPI002FF1C221
MNLYLLLLAISLLSLSLQWPPLHELTLWHFSAIEQGQWWRILTGNFAHTNFAHWAMNLAALWIISFVFKPTARQLLISLVLISLAVGVMILASDMQFYVGLSGSLHGLFAYYALNEALNERRSSWLLVLGIIGKVGWEQWFGASASTAELIGARIATEAHLAGLVSGLVLAAGHFFLRRKLSQ